MASGQPMIEVQGIDPPGANAAQLDTRAGGSTPTENGSCISFDADAIEYMDLKCRLSPLYGGGGLRFNLGGRFASATTGNARMGAAIRRHNTGEDWDTSHSYDYNEINVAAAATNGQPTYGDLDFTNGADMDSLAAGEEFTLRLRRNATDATNDTAAGDFQLSTITCKEI